MKDFFKKIWEAIKSFFVTLPVSRYLFFIAGLVVAAIFGLPLHMKACLVPVLFVGFIKDFIGLWATNKWDWWDFAATISGGAVIQILVLL